MVNFYMGKLSKSLTLPPSIADNYLYLLTIAITDGTKYAHSNHFLSRSCRHRIADCVQSFFCSQNRNNWSRIGPQIADDEADERTRRTIHSSS